MTDEVLHDEHPAAQPPAAADPNAGRKLHEEQLTHEAQTPIQRFEAAVEEAGRLYQNGGSINWPLLTAFRDALHHMRGDAGVHDKASFDGSTWTVTRPGLHSVMIPPAPGMTIEQAIEAARPRLDDYARAAAGLHDVAAVAVLAGNEWTVTRGTAVVTVPAEPGMSPADAIVAAAPALDEADKAEADRAAAAQKAA